jgi:hypothetical protein
MAPKQHPVGFGWQPKAATKLTDSIPRTLEVTLVRTFIGTGFESVHLLVEDIEYIDEIIDEITPIAYSTADPKIDGWSIELINKELNKYGH